MNFKKISRSTFLSTVLVIVILIISLTILLLNTHNYLIKKNKLTSFVNMKKNTNLNFSGQLKVTVNSSPTITSEISSNSINNVYNPENSMPVSPLQTNNSNLNQSPTSLQTGPNYNNPNVSSQIY